MPKFTEVTVERVFQVKLSEKEIRAILSARAALQNDGDPNSEKDFMALDLFSIEARRILDA